MKFITPKTSVRPAAIRNSRIPSWRPLRTWTMKRAVFMPSLHRTIRGVRIEQRLPCKYEGGGFHQCLRIRQGGEELYATSLGRAKARAQTLCGLRKFARVFAPPASF